MESNSIYILGMSWTMPLLIVGILAVLMVMVVVFVAMKWGVYWLQAYSSGAEVRLSSLIAMTLLGIKHSTIVDAKVMGRQAGLRIDADEGGMSTARLMSHVLAGGDVSHVIRAIIAADRAGIQLDYDRAAAIDLAGRDVLAAVQTSILPQVIRCPPDLQNSRATLSAIARNGVELKVSARVTVRTNLNQLIGGATEETIIARVGQGIITAIGLADNHMDVLAMPSQIAKNVLDRGLDASTAFEIVSIDIANIEVGANIGARLQIDQANADTRIAQAHAEGRRAEAVAETQVMRAKVVERRSQYVLSEALIPTAIAEAFRQNAWDAVTETAVHPLKPIVTKPATKRGFSNEPTYN
ncbi:MAG: flotillin-like FloA family protein [Pirellula sp.]|jgi:uncharacterized protein YqfA (UPF0365 family)